MKGHGSKFSRKKEQAIAALLSHKTVEQAARAAGVSANTLYRWLKAPEFGDAYQEERHKNLEQANGRLQDATGAAVATVLKIMVDQTTPKGIQLRAAEIVLDRGTKASEMEEIKDRLTKLERATATKLRERPVGLLLLKPMSVSDSAGSAQIDAPRQDSGGNGENPVE